MDPTLLWVLAIVLIVIGLAGTVLPGVPGVIAVFGGMLLAAWIDDFTRIGGGTVVLLGVLTALAFAAEIVGSLLGAKRVGAGELLAQRRLDAAARVGFGTWLGLAVGNLAKLAVVGAMLGVFGISLLVG